MIPSGLAEAAVAARAAMLGRAGVPMVVGGLLLMAVIGTVEVVGVDTGAGTPAWAPDGQNTHRPITATAPRRAAGAASRPRWLLRILLDTYPLGRKKRQK